MTISSPLVPLSAVISSHETGVGLQPSLLIVIVSTSPNLCLQYGKDKCSPHLCFYPIYPCPSCSPSRHKDLLHQPQLSFPPTGGADLPPTPAATLASPPALLAFRAEVDRTYWNKLLARLNGKVVLNLMYYMALWKLQVENIISIMPFFSLFFFFISRNKWSCILEWVLPS